MKRTIIDPTSVLCLPTRRTPQKQMKLESISKAFETGTVADLPEVILFNRGNRVLVADGNHRILLAIKYQQRINAIELDIGEEFLLRGKPLLNYGRRESYLYQNSGLTSAYVEYCRAIALTRGYNTFNDLFEKHIAA